MMGLRDSRAYGIAGCAERACNRGWMMMMTYLKRRCFAGKRARKKVEWKPQVHHVLSAYSIQSKLEKVWAVPSGDVQLPHESRQHPYPSIFILKSDIQKTANAFWPRSPILCRLFCTPSSPRESRSALSKARRQQPLEGVVDNAVFALFLCNNVLVWHALGGLPLCCCHISLPYCTS